MVEDNRIAEIIETSDSLRAAARALVNEANARGGRDNITVVIFRLEDVDEADAEPVEVTEQVTLVGERAKAEGLTADAVRAAAARARPAPRERRSARLKRWRRPLLRVAIGLAVLAVLIAAAVLAGRQVYFLGVDDGGRPALYRGLPYELPLGIDLYDERSSLPIQASAVPADRRGLLTDHDWRSQDDAASLLRDLYDDATAPATGAEE
jgi:protein phosphatase